MNKKYSDLSDYNDNPTGANPYGCLDLLLPIIIFIFCVGAGLWIAIYFRL